MPYIILDRDGVINYDSDVYIKTPDEWVAIPGSLEAIADLNRAGFRVIVATNQSGIARGFYDLATLDMIHEKMQYELNKVGGYIDAIYFCPHHPDEHCACRKPAPGLFYAMREKFPIVFDDTYFIGDKWSDVEAAYAVGLKPLLIKYQDIIHFKAVAEKVLQFSSLRAAVDFVLSEQKETV